MPLTSTSSPEASIPVGVPAQPNSAQVNNQAEVIVINCDIRGGHKYDECWQFGAQIGVTQHTLKPGAVISRQRRWCAPR
jgi:hypothetical protein